MQYMQILKSILFVLLLILLRGIVFEKLQNVMQYKSAPPCGINCATAA